MLTRAVIILLILFCIPVISHPENEEGGKRDVPNANDPKPSPKAAPSIFIMDKGYKPVPRLVSFMVQHNRSLDTSYLSRLLRVYISECQMEGVNYDIAVVQMCLETGFLRFNGSVSRFQNNFCGLGAVSASAAGDWFGSMEEGIRAHIQHLKAYASTAPLTTPPVDKRFHHVRRGTVFTLYDLTGRWATDPKYGEKLEYLLRKLYSD
ncbi:MAG: glucosaminidase domain-containing protein [Bacteroidales bacterium]|nr:glucosaminidase domain-containing protein [Bacteroidales bacterium]